MRKGLVVGLLLWAAAVGMASAQTPPPWVRHSGVLRDQAGTPRTGTVVLTLEIYPEAEGGNPLWREVQTVEVDAAGRYAVLLGGTTEEGLPLDIFAKGDARWLEVRVEGDNALPRRVLLLSVPYALKAADADTLGGKPISAFVLTEKAGQSASSAGGAGTAAATDTTTSNAVRLPNVVWNESATINATSGWGLKVSAYNDHLVLHDAAQFDTDTNWWYLYRYGGNGKLSFYHNGADRLTLDHAGYVGIGTPAPEAKLDVRGNIAIPNNSDLRSKTFIGQPRQLLYADAADYVNIGDTRGWLGLNLFAGADTPAITATAAGYVGIGRYSPTSALHIGSGGSPIVKITGSGGTSDIGPKLRWTEITAVPFQCGETGMEAFYDGLDNSLVFRQLHAYTCFVTPPASPAILVVDGVTDSVGVGVKAPEEKLHVAGNIKIGTGTTGCVLDADGGVIAGTCFSDRRFKKDITPFARSLEKLSLLQPVHFSWRADEYPDRHFGASQSFGLIAQDVEPVLPELVTTDAQGFEAVRYSALPLYMLQAIKELKAENDALKARLQAQEERLRELERGRK